MKPGGTIGKVISRINGTPLYWPVEIVGKSLQHLAEARERFAERSLSSRLAEARERFAERSLSSRLAEARERFAERSLSSRLAEARERFAERSLSSRLQAFTSRFSTWIFRAVAHYYQEPGIENLRRMPPDPDIPDSERQLAAYSAVMAAFRIDTASERNRFSLSHPSALRPYLELVGVATSPSDEKTPQQALSRSRPRPGELPEFMFNPRSVRSGTLNHELSHELFHTASPLGGGLCLNGHVRELLANRFAVEMTHPVPWLIYSAETDAARMLDSSFAIEEVMRISSRPMFAITIPVNDGLKGSIVLQARGSLAQWGDLELIRSTQSWDDLVLWSKPGKVDYYPPGISWKPELIPTAAHGFVNLQTTDGLYYVMQSTDDVWSMFTESGIVAPDDFAGLSAGPARFNLRDLPEIVTEDRHVVIEGGKYLVIHMPRKLISFPQYLSHETYQLFAIKDEDGYLFQGWEQAVRDRKPGLGPLLPPLDPQRHEHLAPFDNWWLANREWREITFDFWSEMMANKFMRDLTAAEEGARQIREAAKIEDILNGRNEPGFVTKSVRI